MRSKLRLFFLLILCSFSNINGEDKINKTIIQNFDITGDKIPDKIILNYFGENINDPFSWTMKIYSDGNLIYSSPTETYQADEVFNNPEYFENNCTDFKNCKLYFYDIELLKNTFRTQDAYLEIILDEAYEGSIWNVAKTHLINQFHIPENKTGGIIEKMVTELKTRSVTLMFFPLSPFYSELPMMYVDDVKGFVKVYCW